MGSMGSGTNSPRGLDSSSSLELALDRAIAQRWAGQERTGRKRRLSPYPASLGLNYTPTPKLPPATSAALAVPSRDTALAAMPTRLRWRGIEVTEEFQAYAARVERGEELAPYRGPVLSRACAEFPWSAAPPAMMLPPAPLPVYPERGRSLKTALWVTGALASIVGALGVGAGAASVPGNELDASIQNTALALKPAPVAHVAHVAPVSEALTTLEEIERSDEAELPPRSIGAPQRAALAAPTRPATTRSAIAKPVLAKPIIAKPANATATVASTPELAAPLAPPTLAEILAAQGRASSAPSANPAPLAPPTLAEILAAQGRRASSVPSASPTASQSLPTPSPVPSNLERMAPSNATTATATGTDASADATPGRNSTLFSDHAPF
jgi:hypothetical protein